MTTGCRQALLSAPGKSPAREPELVPPQSSIEQKSGAPRGSCAGPGERSAGEGHDIVEPPAVGPTPGREHSAEFDDFSLVADENG